MTQPILNVQVYSGANGATIAASVTKPQDRLGVFTYTREDKNVSYSKTASSPADYAEFANLNYRPDIIVGYVVTDGTYNYAIVTLASPASINAVTQGQNTQGGGASSGLTSAISNGALAHMIMRLQFLSGVIINYVLSSTGSDLSQNLLSD
jgi:hypothetical protein